ncbi:MAG: TolC family protein, partial [bacterium]
SILSVSGHANEVLTWDDCVRETSSNNLSLKAAKEDVNSFSYKKRALWSNFLPAVNAGLSDSYGNSSIRSGSVVTPGTGATSYYSVSVTASQNLFAGFQNKAQLDQAQANMEVKEWTLADVKAQISFNLTSAFAQLMYAEEYVKLTDDIVKRRGDNFNLVRLRFEGGNENKGSFLLSKATLDGAELDHIQALRFLEVAKQQLASVLGRNKLGDDIEIKGDVPLTQPDTNVDIKSISTSIPGHQKALSQVKASQSGLTIARSNFYPSLNLTGTSSRQGSSWFPQSRNWSVTLGLTIPLFNGGNDFYSTFSAASALSSTIYSQQDTDVQALFNIKQAYTSFLNAVEQVKVSNSFVAAATVRSEIGRAKYNNGILLFEEWDIIENDLINRQKTALQNLRDRIIAEAAWLQAQGKGVIK